ncbi:MULTISPECIES: AIM24 family protein [Paraburkholderia]|uniref:AIM24 family protein n=1 Tax=Paraburkholderia TaxID=1822464 RepID=UPI002252F5B1|nr:MULTISPECIES: AIM24 family protein [Paraburkholderia]MCX4163046.1 AIM24 family protein [Paraburkholderia megapolitana]MDN7158542.1 AIM24 family protein [Paraburkholderia sp. CHISQ3]MDQ6495589.1 AIM24 family protein [Paraburkholderia megapolitana]
MNQLPRLLPTAATDETFGGVTYHIGGELVPVLSVDVSNTPVYFEHHILLWKNSNVRISIKPLKGAVKRMLAGMQVFVTEASGDGVIAFSRDGAGHVVPIHLRAGEELHVREHQFLAATESVEYTFERVRGITNMFLGQTGFFIDKFRGHREDGVLWLHGYGNVFEKVLAAGETIDVEPGGWLYKDPGVKMDTAVDRLSSGLFAAGFNFIVNRFTGPGRVGIQSMYVNNSTSDR